MEERAWYSGLVVLAIGLAFALVSAMLWASGGRSYRLLRAKLRLGGLLLGLGAMATGCGEKEDSIVMCYEAIWDSDSYADPDIEVDNTSLDFGVVVVGETATLTLTVHNNGNSSLTVDSVDMADAAFTSTFEGPVGLAADGDLSFEVSFAPSEPQAYESTLTIASDDPDHPTVEIVLLGDGVIT